MWVKQSSPVKLSSDDPLLLFYPKLNILDNVIYQRTTSSWLPHEQVQRADLFLSYPILQVMTHFGEIFQVSWIDGRQNLYPLSIYLHDCHHHQHQHHFYVVGYNSFYTPTHRTHTRTQPPPMLSLGRPIHAHNIVPHKQAACPGFYCKQTLLSDANYIRSHPCTAPSNKRSHGLKLIPWRGKLRILWSSPDICL